MDFVAAAVVLDLFAFAEIVAAPPKIYQITNFAVA